jgi:hypothetical protein
MTVRILITVSRSWSEWSTMRTALEKCHAEHPDAVLVHGDAPRGDRDAAGIWRGLGGQVQPWPARWREHGDDCRCTNRNGTCRFAGMRRNLAMVESAPALVLAFINRGSKGASHCAKAAKDAGIPVVRYEQSVGAA